MNNFDVSIATVIIEEHEGLNGVYGTVRLKYHIEQKLGLVINHKCIRRYKNTFNCATRVRKKRPLSVKRQKEKSHLNMAPYIMNENFTATQPLEKLSTDVSYIPCTDGLLYLSAVKDLFNNEIISYSLSTKNNMNLIKGTFKDLEKASTVYSMINSDQGALYYSGIYIEYLEEKGYLRSMSRRGYCWQNSPVEN